MKFSSKDIVRKTINEDLYIDEYCSQIKGLPMDGAIAYINCSYGPKLNKIFTELFFVLEGKLVITIDEKEHALLPNDMFILSPDVIHTIKGEKAKVFIACSPQFASENSVMIV